MGSQAESAARRLNQRVLRCVVFFTKVRKAQEDGSASRLMSLTWSQLGKQKPLPLTILLGSATEAHTWVIRH
ncbi:hypothetical protein chiPu_0009538 [Chiloscyllium punctatum]|uniref:Uncharacterized protein n=1 Tax=Chiloscyllium punctatum TaxID=137246 RepID=A0A401SL23_CHIPU|nr:hypothetical protein [Chiloscyllium punctatum]